MKECKTPNCFCNGYTEAVADARKYREKALAYACQLRTEVGCRCSRGYKEYCKRVIEEVDGK